MRRLIVFAMGSVLAVLVLVALIAWVFDAFGADGVSGHGAIALVIGVVMTTLVGVGLMSLVFYSARFHGEERPHEPGGQEERSPMRSRADGRP